MKSIDPPSGVAIDIGSPTFSERILSTVRFGNPSPESPSADRSARPTPGEGRTLEISTALFFRVRPIPAESLVETRATLLSVPPLAKVKAVKVRHVKANVENLW